MLIPGYTFTRGSNQDRCVFQSQERGDTDRAVERLSQHSNLSTRAQEKCGVLLSMLLAKSWPKSPQGANTPGLDPVTVEFLLSWNSMAGYFRFFGIVWSQIQFPFYQLCMLITAVVKRNKKWGGGGLKINLNIPFFFSPPSQHFYHPLFQLIVRPLQVHFQYVDNFAFVEQ